MDESIKYTTCSKKIVEDAVMISGGRIYCSSCVANKEKCTH